MTPRAQFSRFLQLLRPRLRAEASEPKPAAIDVGPEQPELRSIAFEIIAHIQGLGDKKASDDGWAGRISGWGNFEGFFANCHEPGWHEQVSFQAIQADGTLAPPVRGGGYCGTRGRMTPLNGFVMHVELGARRFAGITYQGVFQDNFRSGLLTPGTLCVSPTRAPLRAMRITTDPNAADAPKTAGASAPGSRPGPGTSPAPVDGSVLDEGPAEVSLVAHIAGRGDRPAEPNGWAGDPNGSKAIEGFSATHTLPGWPRHLTCRAVLPDGSLAPAVKGGLYCGTRGKGQPLHGFRLDIDEGRTDLAALTYEGVFLGGVRSPLLRPGETCASPGNAPMVAMRISMAKPQAEATSGGTAAPENIRLVIWDLDETFWGGTLTEGGIVWQEANAEIVRALARRGIISSICSKNDPDDVLRVLDEHGMRDHFVFPSISWDAKGPRLAALIKDVQLRAPSVLFIDDNPLNRAEAVQFVMGLNVRDQHRLADLLDDPLLQGKPDPERTRLEQYRLLERRQTDRLRVQGDTTQFLRESDITVRIEHDIEQHIDRAVELINRTNQLNFTKQRLPDDPDNPETARSALRTQLSSHLVQAGLLHVRDRYGDYGHCGFYAMRRDMSNRGSLLHFAFSCRILGMGIETWLYRHLNRPQLMIVGQVLADVLDETRVIDWIAVQADTGLKAEGRIGRPLRYVYARGACEMRALSHYFTNIADKVFEDFQVFRNGQSVMVSHSLIASQALRGMPAQAIADFVPLGFLPEDFDIVLRGPPDGPAVWIFGFALENRMPIYRHIATGAFLPASVAGLDVPVTAMMNGAACGVDPAIVAHLREKFTLFGQGSDRRIDGLFRDSLRQIFAQAPSGVRIFVFLSNTHILNVDGTDGVLEHCVRHNAIITEAAAEFSNVDLLSPQDFMSAEELATLENAQHFDRIVYFRIFRHILERLKE